MKKIFRLSLKRDFKNVFDTGKNSSIPEITLKYCQNNLNHPRLAIIISSKVSKSAVKRNQLRRRIREILRKKLDLNTKHDLIFITRPEILNRKFPELQIIIERLLNKTGLSKFQ